jgi:hypothetical protein
MGIKRKGVLAAVGVLGLTGIGTASALAQSSHAAPAPKPQAAEPTGPDTDQLQVGDQTTPDAPAAATPVVAAAPAAAAATPAAAPAPAANADEKPATAETETTTVEEPGDQSLPGGGHADPAGQNVDHQFDGVE